MGERKEEERKEEEERGRKWGGGVIYVGKEGKWGEGKKKGG